MKITIIVFSPSGNTLTSAKMIKESFTHRGATVQLVDFTRREELADNDSIAAYLEKVVKPHDILVIGGPIYVGHIQENVKKIIKALPLPNKKWSSFVIPFASYGGVHSSIALKEAAKLLKKRDRVNIAGLKIAAPHSLTKHFNFIFEI